VVFQVKIINGAQAAGHARGLGPGGATRVTASEPQRNGLYAGRHRGDDTGRVFYNNYETNNGSG